MQKFLLLYMIFPLLLSAFTTEYEVKIYDIIFSSFFPKKETIAVWTDNHKQDEILYKLHHVRLTYVMRNADILLIAHSTNIHNDIMKFVTSYKLLQHYKESVVGGFYWKKGRPNIIFLRKNLQKYDINLPTSLSKYIEEAL